MYADCNHHIYIVLGNTQTNNMSLAESIYISIKTFS